VASTPSTLGTGDEPVASEDLIDAAEHVGRPVPLGFGLFEEGGEQGAEGVGHRGSRFSVIFTRGSATSIWRFRSAMAPRSVLPRPV
jgi:hypothetical protein